MVGILDCADWQCGRCRHFVFDWPNHAAALAATTSGKVEEPSRPRNGGGTRRLEAYAPDSKFAVGAAVQRKSGAVVTGSNIENISDGLTICAERIAISSAVAAGQREFVAIAVVADTTEPIMPCGACRQFLAEFSPDLIIVSATVDGNRKIENLSRLLPGPKRGILKNVHTP